MSACYDFLPIDIQSNLGSCSASCMKFCKRCSMYAVTDAQDRCVLCRTQPHTVCPVCDMQVAPALLVGHRCQYVGRRDVNFVGYFILMTLWQELQHNKPNVGV